MLPQVTPVTSQTLNYSPVAVGIVFTYAVGFWLLSGRKWFAGPIKQIQGQFWKPSSDVDIVNEADPRFFSRLLLLPCISLTAEEMGIDISVPGELERAEKEAMFEKA